MFGAALAMYLLFQAEIYGFMGRLAQEENHCAQLAVVVLEMSKALFP